MTNRYMASLNALNLYPNGRDSSTEASLPSTEAELQAFTDTLEVLPSGSGAVSRPVGDKLRDIVNVRDFGAVGDGSTQVHTKINNLITAVNAAGGGTIFVPASSAAYMIGAPLIMRSNVFLHVDPGATIKLANSSNCSMIEGLNFATLTGTNSGSGISNFGVVGYGLLDGNRANNTSPASGTGHGIAFYGRNFRIDIRMQNLRRRGLHSEYGNGSVGVSPFNGHVERLVVISCGEEGWWNRVSDTHLGSANIKSAGLNADATYDGIYLGANGSIRGTLINIWTGGSDTSWPRAALYMDCGGATISNMHLETGKTANLIITGEGNQIDNLESYNYKGAVNVQVLGTGNRLRGRLIRSTLGPAASVGLQIGDVSNAAFGNKCEVYVANCENGLIDLTHSGGANWIELSGGQDTGLGVAGWTLSSDQVFGRISGDTDAFYFGGRGLRSVQLGYGASAAGTDSLCIGRGTTASSTGGFALGNQSTCQGTNTIAIGSSCNAASLYATAWGQRAKGAIQGEHARATYMSSATGDRQESMFLMGTNTTNATATELSTTSASSLTRLVLDVNSLLDVTISVTGVNTADRTKVFRATYKGAIKKDSTAGSTAFVNSGPSSDVDAGNPVGWACTVSADTTNGSLKILVTGAAATNIAWLARVVGVKIVA